MHVALKRPIPNDKGDKEDQEFMGTEAIMKLDDAKRRKIFPREDKIILMMCQRQEPQSGPIEVQSGMGRSYVPS